MTRRATGSRESMMRTVPMCAVLICLFCVLPLLANDSEIYTWHSVTGSEADARFIRLKYGMVQLETAEGKRFQIALGRLTPEDRALAERLATTTRPEPPRTPSSLRKPPPPAKSATISAKLREQLGETLETVGGISVPVDKLSGAEKIGLYFAAHWDVSCREFSARLVKAYKELKAAGTGFEVVLVSSDLSKSAMQAHMSKLNMPWYAVPFDGERRRALGQAYDVTAFPRLVIISPGGKILSREGAADVTRLGKDAYDAW